MERCGGAARRLVVPMTRVGWKAVAGRWMLVGGRRRSGAATRTATQPTQTQHGRLLLAGGVQRAPGELSSWRRGSNQQPAISGRCGRMAASRTAGRAWARAARRRIAMGTTTRAAVRGPAWALRLENCSPSGGVHRGAGARQSRATAARFRAVLHARQDAIRPPHAALALPMRSSAPALSSGGLPRVRAEDSSRPRDGRHPAAAERAIRWRGGLGARGGAAQCSRRRRPCPSTPSGSPAPKAEAARPKQLIEQRALPPGGTVFREPQSA